MVKTINTTESFIEAWEGQSWLRDVSSVSYKNSYDKAYLCFFGYIDLNKSQNLNKVL